MPVPSTYVIRTATAADEPALRRLAALDSQPVLSGPALVGEIDGRPTAAISLTDGRVVADPFVPTADLRVHVRMRADVLLAGVRAPSRHKRLNAALQPHLTSNVRA